MNPDEDLAIPGEDLAAIIDYLDGRFSEAEMIAFEGRLSREPDLAREHEAFARLDHLQRRARLAPRTAGDARRWGGRAWLVIAAALLAIVGLRWLADGGARPGPAGLRVAVLPSGATLLQHGGLLGIPGDVLPPGFGPRGTEAQEISARAYAALVADAEEARRERALDGKSGEARAEYFVLPLDLSEPASVIVSLLPRDGGPARIAFPSEMPWSPEAGRLPAGEHVLPSPNVTLLAEDDSGERIDYRAGILVPRGCGSLEVLVAVRSAPLDEALRPELERTLSGSPAAAIRAWLEERGFAVRALEVREP